MDTHPSLDGVHLQLERAKIVINDLGKALTEFAASNPYNVRTNEQPDGSGHVLVTLTAVKNPSVTLDPKIVLMAGEALYHLRSSLDHLVNQLALVNNPCFNIQDPGWIAFPICKCRDKFRSKAKRMGMEKLLPSSTIPIIEGEQPYRRSVRSAKDDVLWCLHELHNTDKHRLIPVTVWQLDTITAYAGKVHWFSVDGPYPLEENEVKFRTVPVDAPQEKINAEITCTVAFQHCGTSAGVRIALGQFMWNAWVRVHRIVDRFKRFFPIGP